MVREPAGRLLPGLRKPTGADLQAVEFRFDESGVSRLRRPGVREQAASSDHLKSLIAQPVGGCGARRFVEEGGSGNAQTAPGGGGIVQAGAAFTPSPPSPSPSPSNLSQFLF